jgi:hypothetical protein
MITTHIAAAAALFGSAIFAQDLAPFTAESRLAVSQFQTSAALSIPENVLQSAEVGASEIRQRIAYDPAQKLIHVVGFESPVDAPIPTEYVSTASTLWSFDMRVDSVTTNEGTANVVVIAGSYLAGSSPFSGNVPSTAVVSFAYTESASETSFRAISVSLVGSGTTFASAGTGRIGVARAAVSAVASPRGATITAMQFTLDGRRSSSTAPGALTYEWQFLSAAGQVVQLTGERSSVLTVALQEGNPFVYGDYTFRLTVRNASGVSASDTVTVSVVNPSEN